MPDNITDKVDKKWMYEPKEGEQFFFMHIPKTGGTTFRNILVNHFDLQHFYPSESDLRQNNGKYLSQKDLIERMEVLQNKNLITGHYGFALTKHLKPNVKTLTFLRNPISRIMSHINHIHTHDTILKGADANDIIEKRLDLIVQIQSRMLGYTKKKRNVAEIRDTLESIAFIGIQERYQESIELCNATLGWKLSSIGKMNVSKKNSVDLLTESSFGKICSLIGPEINTYNTAYRIFEKRLNENQIAK